MKKHTTKTLSILISFLFTLITVKAQTIDLLKENSFVVNDLASTELTDFLNKKIENSQFIMLGEQHGIKEVGDISNVIFNISKPFGYNTLCIETDFIAAKTIENIFSKSTSPSEELKQLYQKYPFSIPFYNNKDDIKLFSNIIDNGGKIWGVDQTFMVQFRLNFEYIIKNSESEALKKAIKLLLEEAKIGFQKAIDEKNLMAPFIFKYSDDLHNQLVSLTNSESDKNLLNDLKMTREIYNLNFQKEYYLNNNKRAELMKRNFLNYYNNSKESKTHPKVLFKLGANHVKKGLNNNNVFDISNMISELAIVNGKTSLHIYATGINGTQNIGNPFTPVSIVPFDNSKDIPEEVRELMKNQLGKYFIIDTEPLRVKGNSLTEKMNDLALKYDILIYIKDCEAVEKL
ncbi:hypothetical protein [Roseivirga echinicomitans]|uniref:Uncharacterized protein n=1 Tax=Roseivirga echinicomitans TaxID=296218 RepID=A0A150X2V9_9BACT|nr:hypothetical protein [Roseivirga echinicomitans]KYG73059.1 hypothetical protein AWN68_10230 [Roseivirga echinicomitans]